jgi:hypothetical protein
MAERIRLLIVWALAIVVSYAVVLGPPFLVAWWVSS